MLLYPRPQRGPRLAAGFGSQEAGAGCPSPGLPWPRLGHGVAPPPCSSCAPLPMAAPGLTCDPLPMDLHPVPCPPAALCIPPPPSSFLPLPSLLLFLSTPAPLFPSPPLFSFLLLPLLLSLSSYLIPLFFSSLPVQLIYMHAALKQLSWI